MAIISLLKDSSGDTEMVDHHESWWWYTNLAYEDYGVTVW